MKQILRSSWANITEHHVDVSLSYMLLMGTAKELLDL